MHAVALAGALIFLERTTATSYGGLLTGVSAALFITAGVAGPLLTGGISSRLPAIAGPTQQAQRRAQGWDVATYGLSATIGAHRR